MLEVERLLAVMGWMLGTHRQSWAGGWAVTDWRMSSGVLEIEKFTSSHRLEVGQSWSGSEAVVGLGLDSCGLQVK